MRKILLFVFFLIAAVSAGTSAMLWRVKADQAQKLEVMNREMMAFNQQKDSLTRSLTDATKFISDVYVQVSNISGEVAVSNSLEKIDNLNYKAQIASKLEKIGSMVDGYRTQMNSAEQQIAALKRQNAAFAGQLRVLEETVVRLKDIIQTQQTQIASLNEELELTKAERDRFKREAIEKAKALVAKQEELKETTEQLNTAYYITGTVDELKAKGIIEKKGSVLIFGGAWQPVAGLGDSTNLVAEFKKINITKETSIPLPYQSYKIVSAHNPALTELKPGEVGVTPYSLKIAKPEKFWAQSKFLIVVEW